MAGGRHSDVIAERSEVGDLLAARGVESRSRSTRSSIAGRYSGRGVRRPPSIAPMGGEDRWFRVAALAITAVTLGYANQTYGQRELPWLAAALDGRVPWLVSALGDRPIPWLTAAILACV